jgi:hypothetical protein
VIKYVRVEFVYRHLGHIKSFLTMTLWTIGTHTVLNQDKKRIKEKIFFTFFVWLKIQNNVPAKCAQSELNTVYK